MNQVVLCIVESPFLDSWLARHAYLTAKAEERRLRLYEMDLQWLNVKRIYENLPRPSEIAMNNGKSKSKDTRTAKEIMSDLVKRLRQG